VLPIGEIPVPADRRLPTSHPMRCDHVATPRLFHLHRGALSSAPRVRIAPPSSRAGSRLSGVVEAVGSRFNRPGCQATRYSVPPGAPSPIRSGPGGAAHQEPAGSEFPDALPSSCLAHRPYRYAGTWLRCDGHPHVLFRRPRRLGRGPWPVPASRPRRRGSPRLRPPAILTFPNNSARNQVMNYTRPGLHPGRARYASCVQRAEPPTKATARFLAPVGLLIR